MNKVRFAGVDYVLKFFLDYLAAIVGLIMLASFLLRIGFCIKTSFPGPVQHIRLVMCLNCKQSYALKFSTLVTNGDEVLDQYHWLKSEFQTNHTLKNDPRIIPIGAFLKKYSLDELPQLFNVLKCGM